MSSSQLRVAVSTDNVVALQALLDNPDITCSTINEAIAGSSLMHLAAQFGSVKCLRALYEYGLTDLDEKDSNDHTPIMWALKADHSKCLVL